MSNTAITREIVDITAKDERKKEAIEQSEVELRKDKERALNFLKAKTAEEKNHGQEKDNLMKQKSDKED